MERRRVVVTGLGALTPVGGDVESSWSNLLDGVSGAGDIEAFDASEFGVRIAAEVKNFDVERYVDRKEARRMDLFIQYGVAAGVQAFEDAGLEEGLAAGDLNA